LPGHLPGDDAPARPGPDDPFDECAGPDDVSHALEQARRDPAVALRPRERAELAALARGEVVYARPRRRVARERAVVVAARVVDLPAHERRVEPLLLHPVVHREPVERSIGHRLSHRHAELAGRRQLLHPAEEAPPLVPIARGRADMRLEPFLPLSVHERPFLRRVTQVAFIELPVAEDAKLFEELADERGSRARHRDVVRGPRERRDLVPAPSRVAAGLGLHLEQHEIGEATLPETPGRREPCDAAADDDESAALGRCRHRAELAVPQAVSDCMRLVDEAASQPHAALPGRTGNRKRAEKLPARDRARIHRASILWAEARRGRLPYTGVSALPRCPPRTPMATRLADLVSTSNAVASVPGRLAKVTHLAALLSQLAPDEVDIAIPFLSGETRQGRLGIGA